MQTKADWQPMLLKRIEPTESVYALVTGMEFPELMKYDSLLISVDTAAVQPSDGYIPLASER